MRTRCCRQPVEVSDVRKLHAYLLFLHFWIKNTNIGALCQQRRAYIDCRRFARVRCVRLPWVLRRVMCMTDMTYGTPCTCKSLDMRPNYGSHDRLTLNAKPKIAIFLLLTVLNIVETIKLPNRCFWKSFILRTCRVTTKPNVREGHAVIIWNSWWGHLWHC